MEKSVDSDEIVRGASGILPFWFWNGKMADSEIIRQIDEMAAAGTSGFFICPRQGLEVPYLSSVWFDKVRVALECAKKHGLAVWIYDEYPYPSGMAGGETALHHPEARHCSLEYVSLKAQGGTQVFEELDAVRVLSARAVPVDPESGREDWSAAMDVGDCVGILQKGSVYQKTGLTNYNRKRFFSSDPVKVFCWNVPPGSWAVHLFFEKEISDFKYYGSYIDPCNEAAVRTFIRLTHERYLKEVGDYFGTVIHGFYTDETGLLGRIPWSPSLPDFFRNRNGYDICDHLPALFSDEAENAGKIRYDFFQTLHLLLRERYHRPISEWCEKQGLTYISEVPAMRGATQLCSGIPAADSGHEKLGVPLREFLRKNGSVFRYNPKNAASIACQCGRSQAIVECFHSIGWSMTLQDAKWMLDRFLAMGVGSFNFHAFFYTTDSLRKHDAPPSQFFQNPYWPHFRLLAETAARAGSLLEKSTDLCSVALLDPVTSLWAKMGNPLDGFSYCGGSSSEEAELKQLKADWVDLSTELLLALRDCHHLDPELLANAKVCGGELCLGHARYRILILPPLLNLEKAAWRVIKQFLKAGGTVIATGRLPTQKIEEDGVDPEEIRRAFSEDSKYSGAVFVPKPAGQNPADTVRDILCHADRLAPPPVVFEAEQPTESFLVHTRRIDSSAVFVFVSNQENKSNRVKITGFPVRLGLPEGKAVFQCLELETGRVTPVPGECSDESWILEQDFGPYESRLIRIGTAGAVPEERALPKETVLLSAKGPWQRKLADRNVLRLDRFDCRIDGSAVVEKTAPKPFINICQENDVQLRLNYTQNFGSPVSVHPAYPVECRFEARFLISEKPGTCVLAVEERAVCGEFKVFLNGAPLSVDSDAASECDVSALLAEGENVLCVEGVVRSDDDGLRDALYLEGDFGVSLSPDSLPVITSLDEQVSEFPVNGMAQCPYYAGHICLSKEVVLDGVPETSSVRIRFEDLDADFHQTAELVMNGQSLGVKAWLPYAWEASGDCLQVGKNLMELKITTSLESKFDGTLFDYKTGTLRDLR